VNQSDEVLLASDSLDAVELEEFRKKYFTVLNREYVQRKGFWLDKENKLYVGYQESEDNFHYSYIDPRAGFFNNRSDPDFPEDDKLVPISFEQGIERLRELIEEGIENANNHAHQGGHR